MNPVNLNFENLFQAPYILTVRAFDRGEPELFSDAGVYITIGDVSSNDGVPRFIKPEVNEVAYILEVNWPALRFWKFFDA